LKYLMNANVSYEELILRFFELFTSAVPPSLPTCLSLGMSYSLYRLKKHDIFCINRERVNLLGTINLLFLCLCKKYHVFLIYINYMTSLNLSKWAKKVELLK